MRFIPTFVHGILDYLVGVLLIASPWLFGFSHMSAAAVYTPVVLGVGALLYSLMTRYELGLIPVIPMTAYLYMDVVSGILLAVSPFMLGFDNEIRWPHVTFGILEIMAGLMTRTIPTVTGENYVPESTRTVSR